MLGYLVRRFAQMLVTLFLFVTLVFFLVNAQPGDFTNFYAASRGITPEAKDTLERSFGLDEPLPKQYFLYIKSFLSGDFGVSFSLYPRSVMSVIGERLPRTLLLFVTATVTSFYLGFAAGKTIGWRRGEPIEYASTLGGVALYTAFTPWLGLMMIWLFAFKLDWLPIGKFLDPLVWRTATVSADHVLIRMILTAVAAST
ncbi:MAG: ABC transporter permease, partial [Chloroflexi bacterium]|nr:ABC transporter permease [Chloroflexota bacterium]